MKTVQQYETECQTLMAKLQNDRPDLFPEPIKYTDVDKYCAYDGWFVYNGTLYLLEFKQRFKAFDSYIIEEHKFERLMEAKQKGLACGRYKNVIVLYINFTPNGRHIWNITNDKIDKNNRSRYFSVNSAKTTFNNKGRNTSHRWSYPISEAVYSL